MRWLLILLCLVPLPGNATELKLATWNLDWLSLRPPDDPALPDGVTRRTGTELQRLRFYAGVLDADVVAFQEVDGPDAASRVFPLDRYDIVMTDDRVVQRVGFAIRHGLHWVRNPDLAALDVQPEARHRLRSGADVTLDLPGGRIRLLAVHLKSGCSAGSLRQADRPACGTLGAQVPALAGWIAQRQADGTPFLVLGDFNRRMDGRDAVLAALDHAAPLLRATAGHANPCWGGSGFIDHIMAGGAARGWLLPDSLRVLVYRETGEGWRDRLSDHCPVSVRLHLPDQP